jgi:prepilin-type N-terminal cleavage/methylation domain-containing protein
MTLGRFDKGFTLIEIVTVIVVLGILGAFTFTFIDNAIKTYIIADKQRNLYQEASYIMERITRELRDMSNLGTCDYSVFDNTFTFYKRHRTLEGIDNISITFRRDTSTYTMYRDGNALPSPVIGRNVTFFRIERGQTGSSLPICNCPFLITLTLQNGDQSITISSKVTPKNLGSGIYNDRCFNGDYEDVVQ